MKTQLKCKDYLGGRFRQNHQGELASVELEISLKLMELFRTSTRSVPGDHENRQNPTKEDTVLKTFLRNPRKSDKQASREAGN